MPDLDSKQIAFIAVSIATNLLQFPKYYKQG